MIRNRPIQVVTTPTFAAILLVLLQGATAGIFGAEESASTIPLNELTMEQYQSLPDEQSIDMGESVTTLGELRAEEAAKREASRAKARRWLEGRQAELAEREAEFEWVEAMVAMIQRRAAADAEAVERARAIADLQRRVYELSVRGNGPITEVEHKRLEVELRELLDRVPAAERLERGLAESGPLEDAHEQTDGRER